MKMVKKVVKNQKEFKGFTEEERAAMKERAKELRAEAEKANGESAVVTKIREMKGLDRALGERLHAIIKENAPSLVPKTWYGFPAYANTDGEVVCFFQPAEKFKTRYMTLGFSDSANLDEGNIWPVTFALKELSPPEVARIAALVKKSVGISR